MAEFFQFFAPSDIAVNFWQSNK